MTTDLIGPVSAYAHNFGFGESVNYVPTVWHTYQYRHMLKIFRLPKRTLMITCSCALWVRAQRPRTLNYSPEHVEKLENRVLIELNTEMMRKHQIVEQQLKDGLEEIQLGTPEIQQYPIPRTKDDISPIDSSNPKWYL